VLLADPQTSGGLLVSVDREAGAELENFASRKGMSLTPFGVLIPRADKVVRVLE
jgi:selenophosphate synthase